MDALAFLRQYNLRGSVPVGKEVVVVGGRNAAIAPREPQYDLARRT